MKVGEILSSIKDQDLEFIKTGLSTLDRELDGGLLRKELVIIGGFTGVGKSYLGGQIFWNSVLQGFNSSYFSTELSDRMIVLRLIGSLANIKPIRIIKQDLNDNEVEIIKKAQNKVYAYEKLMTFHDDLYQIAEIEKTVEKGNPEFVIVDFLQTIMAGRKADEYARLNDISLRLQRLAKNQNCAILAFSQLSNRVAREGLDGGILEYKGSGSIAQVCDLGFYLKRERSDRLKLILRKNRRGYSGQEFWLEQVLPGGLLREIEIES